MTKNNLVSLVKSRSPLDFPTKTPLVSFISYISYFSGTSTLTDIDHVTIMKSGVFSTPNRGGVSGQGETKTSLARLGGKPLASSLCWQHSSKTMRFRETHTHHGGQSHLMRIF